MAYPKTTTNIPIWVRVSGIVALVLIGVVVSSMLLGGASSRGHQMGGMDQMSGMDHSGRQTGPAAPSEMGPARPGPGNQTPQLPVEQPPSNQGRRSDGP